jgi:hypothetical protein
LAEHNCNPNPLFYSTPLRCTDRYFGQRNLIYLSLVGALWYVTGSYEMFFALTSFVHYCRYAATTRLHCSALLLFLWHFTLLKFLISRNFLRYISTFYIRRGIDFGSFKRDVLLFKTIALSQLFYCYAMPTKSAFQVDYISIGMILSGYVPSCAAHHFLLSLQFTVDPRIARS